MKQPDAGTADREVSQTGTSMGADMAEPPMDPMSLEPTDAEIEEWAERERKRREAWLMGPTAEERAAYASRVRERRLAALEGGEEPWTEWGRQMVKYPREVQLAFEGAMSLMLRWSRRSFEELQRAGREWEQDYGNPIRRRRVPLDDDRP
jgi:hypothetical protein